MAKKLKPIEQLPDKGHINLQEVLKFLPVSRAAWYKGIHAGHYPHPAKTHGKDKGYCVKDIHRLIKDLK